ncbi:AAA family ATPase [Albimonas sp. CAU 1670]|uniref:AAA family ATPase n=1 Tax=Albimonas sp. CAU 1670 TaxID=3032599 RepID=UPI0023DA3957|nr:AAA family ATPase [Albimonas sp. CAU 1670]MDF2235191.1 AAA family ATPase [Albimonas sp. CAU 1670]
MTIRILTSAANRETPNAELFRDALLASEPRLSHPDVVADIVCSVPLPGRQLDLVLLYHDPRPEALRLRTSAGAPIHSFVMVVEVKGHSPDRVRFEGASVLVRYGEGWHDATDQCDAQTWAFKSWQETAYRGTHRRRPTFVQRAIWLARAPRAAFDGTPAASGVPVHFADLTWADLTAGLVLNRGEVRTLVDHPDHPEYHGVETLRAQLTRSVRPTRLDLRRMNAVTQTRFDAERTQYIRNLGSGLLLLRGRAGTGKTFSLMQVALHLARRGERTLVATFNHGLIADMNRALRLIRESEPELAPLPKLATRYAMIQTLFVQTFGAKAEDDIRRIASIEEREAQRIEALLAHDGPLEPPADFLFVDEGQDWSERQRDLVYKIFGPERVVVADGVDQFVGADRCDWDRGDVPINRRHRLRASRRTKGATCRTVAEIAKELKLDDWDLEPDPDSHGGRFTVLVEPDPARAVARTLALLDRDRESDPTLKAVDNLVCLPSPAMAGGVNFPVLFDREIEAGARDSWRGFDSRDRRVYPERDGQLRAVQYQSCRGMEGWTTICLGLDRFFDFQTAHPRIDDRALEASVRESEGFLFARELFEAKLAEEARRFAINWLMIPLTRSVDHLVVHLADAESELGLILARVEARVPGSIDWIGPRPADLAPPVPAGPIELLDEEPPAVAAPAPGRPPPGPKVPAPPASPPPEVAQTAAPASGRRGLFGLWRR